MVEESLPVYDGSRIIELVLPHLGQQMALTAKIARYHKLLNRF